MQATFTVLFLAALLLSRVQALTDEFDRASKDESQPLNIWPFLQFATRYKLGWVMRSLVLDAKAVRQLEGMGVPSSSTLSTNRQCALGSSSSFPMQAHDGHVRCAAGALAGGGGQC